MKRLRTRKCNYYSITSLGRSVPQSMTVRHEHGSICREGSVDKGEMGVRIIRMHKIIKEQILLLLFFFRKYCTSRSWKYGFGQKWGKSYMVVSIRQAPRESKGRWIKLDKEGHFILLFCLLCICIRIRIRVCVHVHTCVYICILLCACMNLLWIVVSVLCVNVNSCLCVCIDMHRCSCVLVPMCSCMHVYICECLFVCVHIYVNA